MLTEEAKVLACSWKDDPDDASVLVGYAPTFGSVDLGGVVVGGCLR